MRRKSLIRYIVQPNHELTIYESRPLFGFADLMLQCDYFVLHLEHFHTRDCTTRLVKQINERARQTADEKNEETKRADEHGFCFRHTAKTAKHDLKDCFAKSNSRETDG